MCICIEVLRRVVKQDPSFTNGHDVLIHVGNQEHSGATDEIEDESPDEKNKRKKNYMHMVSREPQVKGGKMGKTEKTFNFDRNGPGGQKCMVGLPLIMRKGIRFRALHRFKSKLSGEVFDKASVYTFHTKRRVRIQQDLGQRTRVMEVYRYSFKDEHGKIVKMSEFELCMNMVYEFAMQREFIIGCTLDKLTIVQPTYKTDRGNPVQQYVSINDTLEKEERVLGKGAIQTKMGRFMRVAVTRVRGRDATTVIDLSVSCKFYWSTCLWEESGFMVPQWKETTFPKWIELANDMREVILAGKIDCTEIQAGDRAHVVRRVKLPSSCFIVPPPHLDSISRFPLYMVGNGINM